MITKSHKFTLIEVVIALALFAGLALTSVTLLSSMSRSLEAQQQRSDHVDRLVSLDKTIKKMITHMVPFSWRDEDNQKLPHFLGTEESLRFVHLNRVNTIADGGLRFIELYVNDESKFVARYQPRPYRNAEEANELEEGAFESILAEDVAMVEFLYASVAEDESSSEELEWLDEWDEERLDIPLAVMVTLTWNNETSETFLWRTAGSSYFERWGAWKNGDMVRR